MIEHFLNVLSFFINKYSQLIIFMVKCNRKKDKILIYEKGRIKMEEKYNWKLEDIFPSMQKYEETKEEIKKEQIAYLKEHEQEIVDFVKAQNPKVESVQIDWNSMQIEESGNGTPQGGGYNLSISGKINQLENTKFSVDFYLEDQNSIPTIKKMGMLNDIYIEENGGWKIFS